MPPDLPPERRSDTRAGVTGWLGGSGSNADSQIQSLMSCRLDDPRLVAPHANRHRRTIWTTLRPWPTLDLRHGIADQEAPQAHAQEEAQEDVEGHPLAAPSG